MTELTAHERLRITRMRRRIEARPQDRDLLEVFDYYAARLTAWDYGEWALAEGWPATHWEALRSLVRTSDLYESVRWLDDPQPMTIPPR